MTTPSIPLLIFIIPSEFNAVAKFVIKQISVGAKSCYKHNVEYNGEWLGNSLQKIYPMACHNACKQKSECRFFCVPKRQGMYTFEN